MSFLDFSNKTGWKEDLDGTDSWPVGIISALFSSSCKLRNRFDWEIWWSQVGYNMAEITKIFSGFDDVDSTIVTQQSATFTEMTPNFRFSRHHNDVSITYYVAGYISRGITKKTKCKDCKSLFSDCGLPLSVQWNDIGATDRRRARCREIVFGRN